MPEANSVNTSGSVGLPAHLPGLDGLRGLAILLVLAHNTSVLEGASGWAKGLEAAFNLGWVGVQLFFVLSGFLITGILRRAATRPGRWKHFMVRRGLRILPLYFGSLALLFWLLPLLGPLPPELMHDQAHQWWLWSFTANWAPQFGVAFKAVPHYWSLAVEEQFYLLWPLAVWGLSRRGLQGLCAGLFVGAWLIRLWMWQAHLSPEWVYESSLARMDALVAGAALALALESPRLLALARRHRRGVWMLACLLMLVSVVASGGLFPRTSWRGQVWGLSLISLMFTAVVLGGVVSKGSVLHNRALQALGRYSFCIYLLHKPLHELLVGPWFTAHHPAAVTSGPWAMAYFAFFTVLCSALALVVYHGFEKHFLALKPRYG